MGQEHGGFRPVAGALAFTLGREGTQEVLSRGPRRPGSPWYYMESRFYGEGVKGEQKQGHQRGVFFLTFVPTPSQLLVVELW